MFRWISVVLLGATTGYAYYHNTTNADRKLVVPFLDVVQPSLRDDPQALGDLSWKVLAGVTALFLVLAIVAEVRNRVARARALRDEA
jgi:hypothetical protein